MKEELLKKLLDQYLTGNITDGGKGELAQLMDDPSNRPLLEALLSQTFHDGTFKTEEENSEIKAAVQQWLLQKINDNPSQEKGKLLHIIRIAAVAAAVVLMLGLGTWYFFFRNPATQPSVAGRQQQPADVDPGMYRAKLTLADGRTIVLDSVATGIITKQDSVAIVNKNGELIYEVPHSQLTPESFQDRSLIYNTLTTARGETYVLTLADGSRVWLNAASSIKFPVSFTGKERKVVITGEAYFEVAKNASRKFIVEANSVTTEVLGTHFNVNAYDDEDALKVTLLEGSVRVTLNAKSLTLKPGEQGRTTADNKLQTTNSIDVEQVTAWKNGYFSFTNADIQTVMRQLERWYDVDVVYEGKIPALSFGGEMQRDLNLSEVLKVLERSQVHFKIENRKIIVLP